MKKKLIFRMSLALSLLIVAIHSFGQNNPPPPSEGNGVSQILPMSSYEFYLSLLVLGFGILVILFEFFLIKIKKINASDTIKFIIITLIIISTLFLITAGYSNDQIAPAVGLLGTIAGYLLGRIQSNGNAPAKVNGHPLENFDSQVNKNKPADEENN
ncbi:hypothetical protein [Algoriphagus terrigena]|uniref:hypothetical protein n=1 Tax=Algoriphagus terrigena TaxID=344884 RepID=UPI00047C1A70|nr:hypothetical protein [Algoriphagus terrigena]